MQEILTIIQLIIWIASAAGVYYKMRNDIALASKTAKTDNKATCLLIKLASERIDKIENDRNIRWMNYQEDQKDQDSKLSEIAIGIAKIQNNIKWIIKNN